MNWVQMWNVNTDIETYHPTIRKHVPPGLWVDDGGWPASAYVLGVVEALPDDAVVKFQPDELYRRLAPHEDARF